MAKFCTECGKELTAGVAFCTECGAKISNDEKTIHTSSQQTHQPRQNNSQCSQSSPEPDPSNKVVGTGTYFLLMLLFALPVIGIIACIIMAFVPKNDNIKHFARAMLIWLIIAAIFVALITVGITILGNSLMDYLSQQTGGQFGDLNEMMRQFEGFEDIMEMFQNGGLENLPIR